MKPTGLANTEAPAVASWLITLSWTATLLASALPYIIWRQFIPNAALGFDLAVTGILLMLFILALGIASLRPIKGFLLALLAFFFGWHIVLPLFSSSPFWVHWQAQLSPNLQFLFVYIVRFIPAILMVLTLIGSNLGRKDLFLTKGNLHAPVGVLSHLKLTFSVSWLRFAALFLLVAAIVLPLYLAATLHPNIGDLGQIVLHLPVILITAVLNSCNEELQFRSIFLARLAPSLGPKHALWITTVIFALAHYYGEPSGPIGVVLAGVAGWIWGMSVLETRSISLAWFLHFVQDATILSFMFLISL